MVCIRTTSKDISNARSQWNEYDMENVNQMLRAFNIIIEEREIHHAWIMIYKLVNIQNTKWVMTT